MQEMANSTSEMTVAGTRAFGDFSGFAKQWFFPRTIPAGQSLTGSPGSAQGLHRGLQCCPAASALHLHSSPFDIQAAGALIHCTVRGVQSVLHLLGVQALQPVLVHPLHVQVGLWQPDRNGSVHLFHLGKQGSVWFAILSLGLALSIEAPLRKKIN